MRFGNVIVLVFCFDLWAAHGLASERGDPAKGQQLFRTCAACHSLVPGRHMTGPSLAQIWERQAGTVDGFTRYSTALKQADVTWDEQSLDAWLADPRAFVPGNRMTFRGLPDETQRRDLIALLRHVSEQERLAQDGQAHGMTEGMEGGGMRRQGQPLGLKALQANDRVVSVRHCGDTYTVVTETGETHEFWEFNLRLKTDSSENGPEPNHPVIIPAGMMGDRAFLVFASPAEISPFIRSAC
ncbi:MAG: c-type cytochrome [Kiloniellaceae bacterium]